MPRQSITCGKHLVAYGAFPAPRHTQFWRPFAPGFDVRTHVGRVTVGPTTGMTCRVSQANRYHFALAP